MLLTELFTQPVEYKVIEDDDLEREAKFTVDDREYTIGIVKEDLKEPHYYLPDHITQVWEVGFSMYDPNEIGLHKQRMDLTGTGNAATIFSTAIAFLKEAVQQKDINAIKIAGKANEPSRVKPYKRLVNTLAQQHNWKVVDVGQKIKQGEYTIYAYREAQQ